MTPPALPPSAVHSSTLYNQANANPSKPIVPRGLKCDLCNKKMMNLEFLKLHLLKEHQIESEQPGPASSVVVTTEITDGQSALAGDTKPKCELCPKRFETKEMLLNHIQTKHAEDLSAPPATPVTDQSQSITSNPSTQTRNEIQKCVHCDKMVEADKMAKHVAFKHPNALSVPPATPPTKAKVPSMFTPPAAVKKGLKCAECGRLVAPGLMQQHMANKHSGTLCESAPPETFNRHADADTLEKTQNEKCVVCAKIVLADQMDKHMNFKHPSTRPTPAATPAKMARLDQSVSPIVSQTIKEKCAICAKLVEADQMDKHILLKHISCFISTSDGPTVVPPLVTPTTVSAVDAQNESPTPVLTTPNRTRQTVKCVECGKLVSADQIENHMNLKHHGAGVSVAAEHSDTNKTQNEKCAICLKRVAADLMGAHMALKHPAEKVPTATTSRKRPFQQTQAQTTTMSRYSNPAPIIVQPIIASNQLIDGSSVRNVKAKCQCCGKLVQNAEMMAKHIQLKHAPFAVVSAGTMASSSSTSPSSASLSDTTAQTPNSDNSILRNYMKCPFCAKMISAQYMDRHIEMKHPENEDDEDSVVELDQTPQPSRFQICCATSRMEIQAYRQTVENLRDELEAVQNAAALVQRDNIELKRQLTKYKKLIENKTSTSCVLEQEN